MTSGKSSASRRTNKSGSVFAKPNGSYCIMYKDPATNKRKKKTLYKVDANGKRSVIKTKRDADRAAIEFMQDIEKINSIESKVEYMAKVAESKKLVRTISIPLDKLWVNFENHPNVKSIAPKTKVGYQSICKKFVDYSINEAGLTKVNQIDENVALKYFSFIWQSGISERSYNAHLQGLKRIFNILNGNNSKDPADNPFNAIESKTVQTQRREAFTLEQLASIFKLLSDDSPYRMMYKSEMRLLIKLMVYTGCRGQDACLMTWDNVDFEKGLISYIPEKTRRKVNKNVTLPIHGDLEFELQQALKSRVNDFVIPNVSDRYERNKHGISKDIKKLIKESGVETNASNDKLRRVRSITKYSMHSFRHTFVSIAAQSGIPLAVVQQIVGHASDDMTRHYTHIDQENTKKAINALPAIGQGNETDTHLEPERLKLIEFAKTANIEDIRRLLKNGAL